MSTLKKRRTNRPAGITVYVTPTCVNCPKTLHLLKLHNIPHTVIDLSKNKEAYTYVTQDLGYRQAPVTVVSDGKEQVSWSGHNGDMIHDHNLTAYKTDSAFDDDVFDEVATLGEYPHIGVDMDSLGTPVRATTPVGNVTGPHLRFHGEAPTGWQVNTNGDEKA